MIVVMTEGLNGIEQRCEVNFIAVANSNIEENQPVGITDRLGKIFFVMSITGGMALYTYLKISGIGLKSIRRQRYHMTHFQKNSALEG